MKKNKYLFLLFITAFAFIFSSCREDWGVDNDEFLEYIKLYIPKAESDQIITLEMFEGMSNTYEDSYAVFLGGPNDATKNITVAFNVNNQEVTRFNESKNKNYLLLPNINYELSSNQVTILTGKRGSDAISIKINPSLELPVGEYILPISISSTDAPVNGSLSTIYFIVKVLELEPGVPEEPGSPIKVLGLGANWGNIISAGPDDILYIGDTNKIIWVYKPDSEG